MEPRDEPPGPDRSIGMTLAEALLLPEFQEAGPVVVASRGAVDRPLRWVHVTELVDIAPLLRPGDLVLTTGISLGGRATELADFVASLAGAGCVGLVIELGRRWATRSALPPGLVQACEECDLPLVVLTRETRFAALTQAVGERIVDRQLADLREAHRVHETFTRLSFGQAGPSEILEAVHRLAEEPVVLETADHRLIDYRTAPGHSAFLDDWQARSARVELPGRTGWDEQNGWLMTRLGDRERPGGRLVVRSPGPPSKPMTAIIERAAAALALYRLHDRDRDNMIRRAHRELIRGLRADPDDPDLVRRCELAGFAVEDRSFIALVLRRDAPRGRDDLHEIIAASVAAAHGIRVPVLVGEVDRDIEILLSAPRHADLDLLVDRLADRILRIHPITIASGRAVVERGAIDRTVREAYQVADAVSSRRAGPGASPTGNSPAPPRSVSRMEDLRLRGLLALLARDDRLRLFVDRELETLRRADRERGSGDLIATVRALLEHPASKSEAAASLHVSRASFYDRLARIERLLEVDLDDPDTRVSLHVALLAADLLPADRPGAGSDGGTGARDGVDA